MLCQTYKRIQIICVDDGSSDSTFEIVKEMKKIDDRIVLYKKENEKSLSKTRNFLLGKLDTELFTWVDSDDYVEKKFIENLYLNMKKCDADLSVCNYILRLNNLPTIVKTSNKIFEYSNIFALEKMCIKGKPNFVLWDKLFKKSLLKEINFGNELNYGEDFVFVYQYLKNCKNVVFNDSQFYHYFRRKTSISHEKFSSNNLKFLYVLQEMSKSEENLEFKKILDCWIALTSVTFLMQMKKNKFKNQDDEIKVKEIAKKYGKSLLVNKEIAKYYKFIFQILDDIFDK